MSRGQLAVLAAAAAVVVLACSVAEAATWPNTTNPTTTAAGSEAIVRSQCFVGSSRGSECWFRTGRAGNFVVLLPAGFISEFSDGTKVDAMDVIKAMLAQKNTLNLSAIPSATSISPAYAAKLATVGVTPAQFLAWLYLNVPPSERPPWVARSSNRPASSVEKPVVSRQPASTRSTANVQRPEAVSSPSKAYPEPAQESHVPRSEPASGGGAGSATTSNGHGVTSSTVAAGPKSTSTTRIAPAGTVTPHTAACPPAYSELNAPNGGRCLPAGALGLNPSPASWWANAWVDGAAGGCLVILTGLGVGAVLRRRRGGAEGR